MCLGFLALGPAPFLLGLPWTRTLAWIDQVLGFVLFGVGFAFVVVRAFIYNSRSRSCMMHI